MTESILSDCPDCDAKRHYEDRYKCGTFVNVYFGRDSKCYEAEIAKLKKPPTGMQIVIKAFGEELVVEHEDEDDIATSLWNIVEGIEEMGLQKYLELSKKVMPKCEES